jgi:phosphoribosylformylglycinamidine cyclo-ligase
MTNKNSSINYQNSGVDIKAGDSLVDWLQSSQKKSHPLVIDGIGGFASLTRLPLDQYKKPLLVSCTDGVGTKALLAAQYKKLEGLGQDLVGMNVNDLICTGGDPYFFLDYWASGKLDLDQTKTFLTSVRNACDKSGCVLIGGETAEMPGLYRGNEFDCAGFATGLVSEDEVWGPQNVKAGTVLWALESSGFHSNGYSLLRKAFSEDMDKWAEKLLIPTALYVQTVQNLKKQNIKIQAAAHITGSGFENILRILPKGHSAELLSYELPELFKEVLKRTKMTVEELFVTLNCGVGFVLAVPAEEETQLAGALKNSEFKNWKLGQVVQHQVDQESRFFWKGNS